MMINQIILLPTPTYGKSKSRFLSKELASWVPAGTRAPLRAGEPAGKASLACCVVEVVEAWKLLPGRGGRQAQLLLEVASRHLSLLTYITISSMHFALELLGEDRTVC